MPNPWDEIADQTAGVVKDALKGFLETHEIDDFVKEKTQQYAKEFWSAQKASSDAERDEHLANLKHIKAQVKGEAARLTINISVDAKNTLGRILETVGGILIQAAPSILKVLKA